MTNPLFKNSTREKPLVSALQGAVTEKVPFWLMRQAGRYLPEYRALREKAGSFLKLCFEPEMAAEVTLQPLKRFDMDAAILFSDILVVPYALGQDLSFAEGEGPRLGEMPDLANIDFGAFDKKLSPVFETVKRVRRRLAADKALIGFAGAPWTIACYMTEGKGSADFSAVKKQAFAQPEKFDALIDALSLATARYLSRQIGCGADAVQIFDSWAGLVPAPYFERWVVKPTQKIVALLHEKHPGFPVIGFPREAGAAYPLYAEKTGVACVGIDQHYPFAEAVARFGGKVALQGNLDPALLLKGGRAMEEAALALLETARRVPFIFNLGHGVIKETPVEHVARLGQIIKSFKR